MKFFKSFWKTIIWTIIVLFLSLTKGEDLPLKVLLNIPFFDKIVHIIMYFVLALVFIHDSEHYSKIKLKYGFIVLISFVFVIGLGGFLEILQRIPSIHRSNDFFDFISDAIGAVIGALTYRIFEPLMDKVNSWFIKQ
jgi:VanZ family protein